MNEQQINTRNNKMFNYKTVGAGRHTADVNMFFNKHRIETKQHWSKTKYLYAATAAAVLCCLY